MSSAIQLLGTVELNVITGPAYKSYITAVKQLLFSIQCVTNIPLSFLQFRFVEHPKVWQGTSLDMTGGNEPMTLPIFLMVMTGSMQPDSSMQICEIQCRAHILYFPFLTCTHSSIDASMFSIPFHISWLGP